MDNWTNWMCNLTSFKETGHVNISTGLLSRKDAIGMLLDICRDHTKIFKISKEITKLLLLTKNNFRPKYFSPFKSIFLDCHIDYREREVINGMLIQEVTSKIRETGEYRRDIDVFLFIERTDSKKVLFIQYPLNKRDGQKMDEVTYIYNFDKPNSKDIALFAVNFLDFVNNPEIELVTVERTNEQNQKRIKRGKLPMPPHVFVNVTGKLKIYLNELQDGGHFSYNYRFWVRGHFRTLRNERRYKNKVGTKIWIVPYIKGKGILIDKVYNVDKQKGKNTSYTEPLAEQHEGGTLSSQA